MTYTQPTDQPTGHPLIRYLETLAAREDRATLATLRGSLREGHELDGLRVVMPFLKPDAARRAEDDAVLLAGLFALHPEGGTTSLAEALRKVSLGKGSESESDSIEKRFMALLASDRQDLAIHLRHAVSLVAASGIGLDWDDLYQAIRYWDHQDDFIRRRWARGFWGNPVEAPESTADQPRTA
jgi:CRISPR system Cascade subunit CasB